MFTNVLVKWKCAHKYSAWFTKMGWGSAYRTVHAPFTRVLSINKLTGASYFFVDGKLTNSIHVVVFYICCPLYISSLLSLE